MNSWRHMTDEEFFNWIEQEKGGNSPIMDEIIRRVEESQLTAPRVDPDCNRRVECPVCLAPLDADFDVNNNMFEVRIHHD